MSLQEKITISDFDAAEFLDDEESISLYLKEVFSDGTDMMKKSALMDVARARTMTDLAEKIGISRNELFEILTNEEELDDGLTQKFLDAVGVSIPSDQLGSFSHI